MTIFCFPTTLQEISPEWLKFFTNLPIKSLELIGDASDGRGMMGTLTRIQLTLTTGKIETIVIKTLPKDPFKRKYIYTAGFARREIGVYNKIFSDLNKFRQENSLERFEPRIPKCHLAAEFDEFENYNFILILEDLKSQAFSPWTSGNKLALDRTHAFAALEQIALWAANSIAFGVANNVKSYAKEYPFICDLNNKDDPACKDVGMYIPYAVSAIRDLIEENVEPIAPEGLANHLEFLIQNTVGIIGKLAEVPWKFQYINHMDLHTENFLFKETSLGIEAVFFDFQAVSNSSPMLDLAFFLLHACESSLWIEELENVFEFYHGTLERVFDQIPHLNISYTIDEMRNEFHRCIVVASVHIMLSAKIHIVDPGPEASKESRKKLKTNLIEAFNKGLLNFTKD